MKRIKAPAIYLITVNAANLVGVVFTGVYMLAVGLFTALAPVSEQLGDAGIILQNQVLAFVLPIVILIVLLIVNVISLLGAIRMYQGQSYGMAYFSSIVSLFMCCALGLPAGIWSIVTLADDDVRAYFRTTTAALPE